ncbi:FecR family protein [Algoriphagus namhaensis]
MNKEKLIRFLNDQCGPEERAEIARWLERKDAKQTLEAIFQEEWDAQENQQTTAEQAMNIYQGIRTKINASQKEIGVLSSRPRITRKLTIAVLILFSFSLGLYFWTSLPPEEATDLQVYEEIIKETQEGERLTLLLPDKTKVTLNSSSQIRFFMPFDQNTREVTVSGEAYFEVAKNPDRPFIVHSGRISTEALGTAFNTLYREEVLEIALVEGSVRVIEEDNLANQVELSPGMRASLKSDQSVLVVDNFDSAYDLGWIAGKMKMEKTPLSKVFEDLEKWYGVDFEIDPQINLREAVSGEFAYGSLYDILSGLSFALDFEFEYQSNRKKIKLMKN